VGSWDETHLHIYRMTCQTI